MNTLFIIGNGLGRAINNKAFSLETGIQHAQNRFQDQLNEIIHSNYAIPQNENNLEEIQRAVSACQELSGNENFSHLLNPNGQNLPEIYKNFIWCIGNYFFQESKMHYTNENFQNFIQSLTKYIKKNTQKEKTRCHIATLNYDALLYIPFSNNGIFAEYKDAYLVDGLWGSGFEAENLDPKYENHFGWYLHLHGSPLFYTDKQNINKKFKIKDVPLHIEDNEKTHLVLGPTRLKPATIANSEILEVYWDYFIRALNESDHIYIIGYSGNDKHVNNSIKAHSLKSKAKVIIIERKGDEDNTRSLFWRKQFDNLIEFDLSFHENILEYNFNL